MKKKSIIFCIVIALVLGVMSSFLIGCTNTDEKPKSKLLVVAPDGAPAYALAELYAEKPQVDGVEIEYKVVSSDELQGLMTRGEADIAILPSNMGANLYNRGVDVKLVGATTFGLMYIVSIDPTVTRLEDLKSKKVHSIGFGQVPEFVLKYVLQEKGISDVTIEFRADGSEIIAGLVGGVIEIGVLGEPAATGAVGKLKQAGKTASVIDLQVAWKDVTGKDGYPQSALFTSSVVSKNRQNVLDMITAKIANANTWLSDNFEKATTAVLASGGVTKLPSVAVVNKINIGFVSSSDIKTSMTEYFEIILSMSPKFIGGKVPDGNFYL